MSDHDYVNLNDYDQHVALWTFPIWPRDVNTVATSAACCLNASWAKLRNLFPSNAEDS
jgi:hypothetical protein